MNREVKPVLVLAWKRAWAVEQLVKELSRCKPKKLYFACDGARPEVSGEKQLVIDCISRFKSGITWDCEVNYLISDMNNGCKDAVNSAISWFFSHEECGIILEEDCIPNTGFMYFASAMLVHYSDVDRVWAISGFNPISDVYNCATSYFYSKYFLCWGWATWRRCWKAHDLVMSDWQSFKNSDRYNEKFDSKKEMRFWTAIWEQLYFHHTPNTWDYQYFYTCLRNDALIIVPAVNMVRNIGVNDDATHTKSLSFKEPRQLDAHDWPEPPQSLVRDFLADKLIFDLFLSPRKPLLKRIANRVGKFFSLRLLDS